MSYIIVNEKGEFVLEVVASKVKDFVIYGPKEQKCTFDFEVQFAELAEIATTVTPASKESCDWEIQIGEEVLHKFARTKFINSFLGL
jgi:hypothetical protein